MPAIEFPRTIPKGTLVPVYPPDPIDTGKYYEHVYDLYAMEDIPIEQARSWVYAAMNEALRKLDLTLYDMGGKGARGMFCVIFYNIGPTIRKHSDLDAQFGSELAQASGYSVMGTDALFMNEWVPRKFAWWLLGIGATIAAVAIGTAAKKRKR